MPLTFLCFCLASLSLAGIPFFSGAASKDAIMQTVFSVFAVSSNSAQVACIYVIMFSLMLLTVSYSVRLIFYVFFNFSGVHKRRVGRSLNKVIIDPAAESYLFAAPIIFLSIMSVVSGFAFSSFFLRECGAEVFGRFLDVGNFIVGSYEYFSFNTKLYILCSFIFFLVNTLFYYYVSNYTPFLLVDTKNIPILRAIYVFLNKKMYFDEFYGLHFVYFSFRLSLFFLKVLEMGVIASILQFF
jgi:NADH-quinone oxidoreductase subunit L